MYNKSNKISRCRCPKGENREPGVIPGRSRHCNRLAPPKRHWFETGKAAIRAMNWKPGDLPADAVRPISGAHLWMMVKFTVNMTVGFLFFRSQVSGVRSQEDAVNIFFDSKKVVILSVSEGS